MADYSNFVSTSSINEREEKLSQARKTILEKAKKKYEANELREKKKKESGEATWMLDTVSKRIHKEQKTIEDAKSRKKKKKKEKKKKKKKHRKQSDSSASSDDSEENESWVEAKGATPSSASQPSGKVQRDSWMEAPIDLFPTVTRQELRDEANREKEKAKKEAEKHLQPGQHARELNPYWKNGGTGLPSAQSSSSSKSSSSSSMSSSSASGAMGDGGLSWMLKSLSRMKEQAKEEGRSLEDIAAERYGSLDRLMSMIRDAEKPQGRGRDGRHTESRERDRHDDRYRSRESDRDRNRDSDRDGRDRGGRMIDKSQSSRFRRPGSDDEGPCRDRLRDENRSNQRSAFRRPGSDNDSDEESRRRNKSFRKPDETDRYRNDDRSSQRSRLQRPDNDNDDDDSRDKRKSFRKPDDRDSYSKPPSSYSRREDSAGDRKKEFYDRRRGDGKSWRKSPGEDERQVPRWKKEEAKDTKGDDKDRKSQQKRDRRATKSSSSSSDSSSDESGDEGKHDRNKRSSDSDEDPQMQQQPPAKVLSEAELNALVAKVFRAEIMGDEALVSQLKATLEEARQVREASKTAGGLEGNGDVKDFDRSKKMSKGGRQKEEDGGGDDNVVVLSRTNKAGMVRPVLPSSSSSEWGPQKGGRNRKRKNVATHSEGERTKYFHDDDNFDLKTLVEREKAGTAEDQNSMFARLAGREKDRDMDVDDMFVNKAARGREDEEAANRDKMAAIMEHRKKSSAMEKCTRCFDKIPKHLIIAIGRKSYLCLPDHASLTEGHCLIVPMGHSTSATSLDEDVWQDMQQFRKSLVQMFLSQEKDVVVMETVMNLKYFPHTAIECIPLEKELGDLAPIYFKKAMQEVGPEWSHNKKVHDLSKKDVRHTVPKGFPYFAVDFGLQGGFAHVIEDEATFPGYFGREIVGGMLDAEPGLWRKPRKQNFEDQRQKVLQFEQWWSPFDWTQDIG